MLQDINAAALPLTRDVMLVFDRSGSMSLPAGTGRSKIEEARDAASLFVQLLQTGTGTTANRVGLVSFSTTASSPVDFGIAAATGAVKDILIGTAPYAGGKVGALTPGGSTTIGGGLEAARLQLAVPGANPRSILLLTDGLQNTPPLLETVAPALSGIDVNVIGYGTAASLDGALLTKLASQHNGVYTRADNSLDLKKFFSLAFGNIFEAGSLMDPNHFLPAQVNAATPIAFPVCGEERLTVVVGWDRDDSVLLLELKTPAGAVITSSTVGVESAIGRTWNFLRVPLPFHSDQDGTWEVTVFRSQGGGRIPATRTRPKLFCEYCYEWRSGIESADATANLLHRRRHQPTGGAWV